MPPQVWASTLRRSSWWFPGTAYMYRFFSSSDSYRPGGDPAFRSRRSPSHSVRRWLRQSGASGFFCQPVDQQAGLDLIHRADDQVKRRYDSFPFSRVNRSSHASSSISGRNRLSHAPAQTAFFFPISEGCTDTDGSDSTVPPRPRP